LADRELETLRNALREHVNALAVDIGPRTPLDPNSLVRVADYIFQFIARQGIGNVFFLPGGGATKVAVELMPLRKAMYHAMMGENIDGKTAASWGLVTEAVPLAGLKDRVTAIAEVLLKKNPVALKATKDAVRRVGEMTYDNAEDYLIRAQEASNSFDNEGRKEGIRQFIDEKSYKPGLGAYDTSKQKA